MEKHETYSVLIRSGGEQGSGLLFHAPESAYVHVVTCSHVVENISDVQITILFQREGRNDPEEHLIPLSNPHVEWYGKSAGEEVDLAVIECPLGDISMPSTEYRALSVSDKESLLAIGYPIVRSSSSVYKYQDELSLRVLRVLESSAYFTATLDDYRTDCTSRIDELRGYSGSPVWIEDSSGEFCVCGLIKGAFNPNASRGRIEIVKAECIVSILRNRFGLQLECGVKGIGQDESALGYAGDYSENEKRTVLRGWIENSYNKASLSLEALKPLKCIEICSDIISNGTFFLCSEEEKASVYILKCNAYRIIQDYKGYDRTIEEMHQAGVSCLREDFYNAIRYYGENNLEKAYSSILTAVKKNPGNLSMRVYRVLIETELKKTLCLSLFSDFIGPHCTLLEKPENRDDERTSYQALGIVLMRLGDNVRAVQCLNRAYEIKGSYLLLESIGCGYCSKATEKMLKSENGIASEALLDRDSLIKARECFLLLLREADEAYLRAVTSRIGIRIFECFVFLMDFYRICQYYPILDRYFSFPLSGQRRLVQKNYVFASIQLGQSNLNVCDALTPRDRTFFSMYSRLVDMEDRLYLFQSVGETELMNLLSKAEDFFRVVGSTEDALFYFSDEVCAKLIKLYVYGNGQFGWNVLPVIRNLSSMIHSPENMDFVRLSIDELEKGDYTLSEKTYQRVLEEKKDFISFNTLLNFYLRHRRIDSIQNLYDTIFSRREDLIKNFQDSFYCSYISFYLWRADDMVPPVRCYLDRGKFISDDIVRLYWEQELKRYSFALNDAEEMISAQKKLLEYNMLKEREAELNSLLMCLLNVRLEEAFSHTPSLVDGSFYSITPLEQMLLMWKNGARSPNTSGKLHLQGKDLNGHLQKYLSESEHSCSVLSTFRSRHRHYVVSDYLSLYFFAKIPGGLSVFDSYDRIYLTHITVYAALTDLLSGEDFSIRSVLSFIERGVHERKIFIQSPSLSDILLLQDGFSVRTDVDSALLLSEVLDCPVFLGDVTPYNEERFGERVMRPVSASHCV